MRRLILLGLLLIQGDIRAQTLGSTWTCSVDEQSDTALLCIAAPEPGAVRYITDIIAQSTTATGAPFQLQAGQSTASGGGVDCSTTASVVTLFPTGLESQDAGRFSAAGNAVKATSIELREPIRVPPGKDICVLGDATNPVTVQVVGYIAP